MYIRRFKAFFMAAVFFLMVGMVACDVNKESDDNGGGTNPNVSDPDDDVAANVGPVEQLVTVDVLNETNDIRNNILTFLDDIAGLPDGGGTEKRVIPHIEPEDEITGTIDLGESSNCDEGGSKDIIGTADFKLESDGATGSIVGSFIIQYDNCQEIVVMTTSNGNCAARPTVDGDVTTTINVSFILSSDDISGQDVDDQTSADATTNSPLDVSVGSTASNQIYNFSYDLSSSSTNNNLNGTVSFENKLFDVVELEEFIEASTTSVVCP